MLNPTFVCRDFKSSPSMRIFILWADPEEEKAFLTELLSFEALLLFVRGNETAKQALQH